MKKKNQSICEISLTGTKCWYLDNKLHRLDGPALEYSNGDKYWFLNDQLHREDGPAIEYATGSRFWLFHNQRHRLDGPAIEYADGRKCWYYYGKLISCSSQEEFERLIKLKALW